jgi:hypothetical protein
MRTYSSIGVAVPPVLLPRPGIDLSRWAVVACDQFTSQPDYWRKVAQIVGDAPSTYHLILPEVLLGTQSEQEKLASIQATMHQYLEQDLLHPYEGLILVERTVSGRMRHGLMLALDLEKYDYHQGSQTLIRASEGTILERLPPRIKIRQGAPLELPHILVLIDDPSRSVIEPLVAQKKRLQQVYDVELMLGSGHVNGYFVENLEQEQQVMAALEKLADPTAFHQKYATNSAQRVLLFAMGDGNHSFATAKAIWDEMKHRVSPDHPARYALVEIENVHDAGLIFEPIHRVVFNVNGNFQAAMRTFWGENFRLLPCRNLEEMLRVVDEQSAGDQMFGVISITGYAVVGISAPGSNLPVGTLQSFLDDWQSQSGYAKIDYLHGTEVVDALARQPGNLGFYLTALSKSDFFKTVVLDGALPRKTFSMGEAIEKRFYMECRKIVP